MKSIRMTAVFMLLAMMMTMLTGCQVPDDPVPRPSEDINVNFDDYEEEAKEFLRITEYESPESDSYDSESEDAASQALNMIVCDALLGYEGEESDKYGKRLFSQIEAECPNGPDPKKTMEIYEKLDGDEVDKVLSDVFNTEPDHTEKAQQSEGEKWYTWYYEDGYYYYTIEGGEYISFLNDVKIHKIDEESGDTFQVKYELISEDDGGSYSLYKQATLKAKKIDNAFQWSLLSYKSIDEEDIDEGDGDDDQGKTNGGSSSSALTKDGLHKAFKNAIGSNKELYFLCDDYDADGSVEAFGITGDGDEGDGFYDVVIYFISSSGKVSQVSKDDIYGYLTMDDGDDAILKAGNDKFIVWELSANGSGSISYIYGVKNGTAYQPDISGDYMDFWRSSSDKNTYVGSTSDFSKGYHDYIGYTFTYNSSTHEFVKSGGGKSLIDSEETDTSGKTDSSGTSGSSKTSDSSETSTAKNLSDSEICKLVYDYAIKNQHYPDRDGVYTQRSLEDTQIEYTEGDTCLVGVCVSDYESPTYEEDTWCGGAVDVYWYNKKTGEIKYAGATQDDPKYLVDMKTGERKDY